jgi:predicted amidohydrolase
MTKLSLTLVQSHLYWENPKKNREHLELLLSATQQTDLIILPELFSTAFSVSCNGEPMNGDSMKWMSSLAKEKKASVVGSLIISENNHKYNRLIWMNADSTYQYYDKRHLFGMMQEESYFKAGQNRLIVDFNGWKICPLICYDLRFPVFSRNNVNFDLMLYVANWPVKRIDHWDKLLVARAIENQCYVVGVNRVGQDINDIEFSGHSSLIDYNGHIIHRGIEKEQVKTLVIDKNDLAEGRLRLPFLKDMDSFTIN